MDQYRKYLDYPIITTVSKVADEMQLMVYVVGGFVRDCFLEKGNRNDIDIAVVGNGIDFAGAVAQRLKPQPEIDFFPYYGTARIKYNGWKLDFAGTRKERYHTHSRFPVIEAGTLEDDQKRRDFTINTMAFDLRQNHFGEFIDPYNGLNDIKNRIICTTRDPLIVFAEDPLRMLRAIRFATQLDFDIEAGCYDAIIKNAPKIELVGNEKFLDELYLITSDPNSFKGLRMLEETGLRSIHKKKRPDKNL